MEDLKKNILFHNYCFSGLEDEDGYDKFLRNNVKISIPRFKDFNSVNSEDPECFIHIEKSLHELEYI